MKQCIVGGFPKNITIKWTLDSKPLRPELISEKIIEETRYFIRIRSRLTISFVRKEDAGLLRCAGSNSLGNDSRITQISVKCKLPTCLFVCLFVCLFACLCV